MSKQILLLSPYDALSHAHWRQGVVGYVTGYQFHQIVLPPGYFSWRYRYSDTIGAVNRIRECHQQWQKGEEDCVPDVSGLSWGEQKDSWSRVFDSLI